MVEQRLHNCRVQGVVSIFNELSNEEKEECLKILQKTNWTITPESERLPDKVNDCLELNDYSGKKGLKRAPKAKNAATEESSVAAFGV